MGKAVIMILGLAGALAAGQGARAGQVDFRTADASVVNSGTSLHFVGSDGVGITATATADLLGSTVIQNIDGLGVFSAARDDVQIDGDGAKEFLILTFDRPVWLDTLRITRASPDDGGQTWLDGTWYVSGLAPNGQPGDQGGDDILFYTFNPPAATVYGATTRPGFPTDDYQIGALSYTPVPTTAIPLPSAAASGLVMMGVLAGGMGLQRLRKPRMA